MGTIVARIVAVLFLWWSTLPNLAAAQPDSPVPPPLRPWVDWVLAEAPERACAFRGDAAICRWPGRLQLELDAHGGRFSQRIQVDRGLPMPLPGGPGRFPLDVRVDGNPAPVLSHTGTPVVRLEAGVHEVSGQFRWSRLPERLAVPRDTAHVDLIVEGEAVAFPRRQSPGELWLRAGVAVDQEGERASLVVHRRIDDGVPLRVDTRITLRVVGRARELALGRVLPEGLVPLWVDSEIPARLERDGSLRLQVRAGTYQVDVAARSDGSPEQLAYRAAGPGWPLREVWVFSADERVRQVELSGAPAIDPAGTDLPDSWRGLPTFALRRGAALAFSTVRRGEPQPPPNRLSLTRELWLDLDGRGYTVRDSLDAELHQGFRLDLLAGDLGHVQAAGRDLLITASPDGGHGGVELRAQRQQVEAEWRSEDMVADLPAVGWSQSAQSLRATLHLGPGYGLFAATGVDEVSHTWLSDWDLFGFFFVLLVSIAVARLCGRRSGLLALVALVLCEHAPGAPRVVWLVLLGLIALLRVLPTGWFRGVMRAGYWATLVSLLLIAVPFAVDQLRGALYPQLADGGGRRFDDMMGWGPRDKRSALVTEEAAEPQGALRPTGMPESEAVSAPAPPVPMRAGGAMSRESRKVAAADQGTDRRLEAKAGSPASTAFEQDPEAPVQTGPGVPSWHFRRWDLRWSGPVDKDHRIGLILITPTQNRLLSLLRVLLLAALIGVLVRGVPAAGGGRGQGSASSGPAVAATAVMLCVAMLLVVGHARAQLPDRALLDDLRQRLTKPASCRSGGCVSVDSLDLRVDAQTLSMSLSVHAGERTAVALPGPAEVWAPAEVSVDGSSDAPLRLDDKGYLQVRLTPGVHTVSLRGPVPPTQSVTLAFSDRPQRTTVDAAEWKVDGVRDDGRVEGTLQLSRLLSAAADEALQAAALPAHFRLERVFELGPIWIMRSAMVRITQPGDAALVRVPLLSGESIIESSLQVVDGSLQVPFGRHDSTVRWSSTLESREKLVLGAAAKAPWTERWKLQCGPIWHCDIAGLAPLSRVADGRYAPDLAPWPGESATIAVRRPAPLAGASLTVDAVRLVARPGVRMLHAELEVVVRTTAGGVQQLELPPDARVQTLTVNGHDRAIRRLGDQLSLTLEPGRKRIAVQWHQSEPLGAALSAPRVGLGRPAANAEVQIDVPRDRWLLWVSGPAWGPAILFWPYLFLVIGFGVALSRSPQSPLSARQWVLLGLGLTQISAPAALVVVAWFFVMHQRGRRIPTARWVHNLGQVSLVVWTLAALGCLYAAVHTGLVMDPEMQVAGPRSSASSLVFYVDRITGQLPTPEVISLPMWCFRLLMLVWSLWLASALVKWLPWAFGCFGHGGLWRRASGGPAPENTPPAGKAPVTRASDASSAVVDAPHASEPAAPAKPDSDPSDST